MVRKQDVRLTARKNKIKTNKYYRKYVDWHPRVSQKIIAIYCKGCGSQIKGLNKDGALIPFWNYREMTIEFDDNSAHMTPICVKCQTSNKDNLEAIYIADLEELELQEDGSNKNAWDNYLVRVPNKIKKEKVREAK